jgi:DNA gyrase/topoisomerase IV subunit A
VHGLTKVLIILAALLSVFLSALVIAYAANTNQIQADFVAERAERQAAVAALGAQQAIWQTEKSTLQETLNAKTAEIAAKQAQIASLQLERTSLLGEKTKAQDARDTIQSKIAELSESVKTMQTLINSYREEVTALRKNEIAYRTQRLELEERLADVESQRNVLQQSVRALQEELTGLRGTSGNAGAMADTSATVKDSGFDARFLITGAVDDVQRDPASGDPLVQISVGSNNGVTDNMYFYVVRGDRFVAKLQVIKTDLKFSIAKVKTAAAGLNAQKGDQIVSSLTRQ